MRYTLLRSFQARRSGAQACRSRRRHRTIRLGCDERWGGGPWIAAPCPALVPSVAPGREYATRPDAEAAEAEVAERLRRERYCVQEAISGSARRWNEGNDQIINARNANDLAP